MLPLVRSLTLAVSVVLSVASAASAGSVDCAAIGDSFQKLALVPAYRIVINDGQADMLQTIAVGDVFYMNAGDGWQEMQLKPGGRQAMAQQMFDLAKITDCAPRGDEAIAAGAMHVYTYVVPPIEGLSPTPAEQKVWIGVADGLPHQLAGEAMQVDVTYEAVVAPAP